MGKMDSNLDAQGLATIQNLKTPVNAGDAVPKSYADSIAAGLVPKPSVRLASPSGVNVTIASPGATLDGIALDNGDPILLMFQATPSQNGIWTWNGATSALTRPSYFQSTSTQTLGCSVYVEEGATMVGGVFTLVSGSTDEANIVVDTTPEVWSQTNGMGDIAVQAPITKSGNTIQLNGGNPLPVSYGGTGANSASGARTNLSVAGVYAQDIGDGSTTTFSVAHGLNSTDIANVNVIDKATGNHEIVDWAVVDSAHVSVGPFTSAPATASGGMPSGTGKRVVVTAV